MSCFENNTPVDDNNLPFVDESLSGTPLTDSESGPLVVSVPVPSLVHSVHQSNILHSRHSSYTSHSSRISYSSHGVVYGRGVPVLPVSWNQNKTQGCYQEVRIMLLFPNFFFVVSNTLLVLALEPFL